MRNTFLLSIAFFMVFTFCCLGSRAQCASGITYTVSPSPPFTNGEVVTICFTVGNYTQNTSNWIHAFLFTLGSAWDPNSIVVTQFPPSGGGTWGFYNSVTSTATGQTYGPGVFYDLNNDGNPGNNYGYSGGTSNVTVCFTVTVANSAGVTDLTIAVTGDGTTGSWSTGTGACGNEIANGIQVISTPPCNYSVIPTSVNPICTSNNGNISLALNGPATPPEVYSWSTGSNATSLSGLAPGAYGYTVTDAANCQVTGNVTLIANFSNSPVVVANATNPTCADYDGQINLTVNGGTAPYSYTWSTGDITDALTNLAASPIPYGVVVEDQNGCTAQASATMTITDYAAVSIGNVINVSCPDACNGSATAIMTAGNPPYNYYWSNNETDSVAHALCAGAFGVFVTDAHGCTATADASLDAGPPLELTFQTEPASCYGIADAKAIATVTNGTPPYTFNWSSNGATLPDTTDTAQNLIAGVYNVGVHDDNGCPVSGTVTVGQPLPMLLGFDAHDARCNGSSDGWVEAAAVQGTPPYAFSWSTGDSAQNLQGVPRGTYGLTVTDLSGCTVDSSVAVSEPATLEVAFNAYPASCLVSHDGWDSAFASGGTPGYNYVWSTQPQSIGPVVENMHAGMYAVTVTDAHNCSLVDSTFVDTLPMFRVHASDDFELIRGYAAVVSVTSDTVGNFGYLWTPLLPASTPYDPATAVMPDSTTTFTVIVTDYETGCEATDSVVVTVVPNPYVHFPNAFSPNGDDRNDMFFPIAGDGVTIKSFKVFDRWGGLMFNGDWYPGWDGRYNGKPCGLGAYVYYCEFTIPDGSLQRERGYVILMR